MLNITLRVLTLGLFAFRWWYWRTSEIRAEKEIPKQKIVSHYHTFGKIFWLILYGLVLVQLFGLPLFPIMRQNVFYQCIGFLITSLGVMVCFFARRELGSNWANGYDYQVKPTQILVTTGIYAYIRHPIYVGLILMCVGGEMVATSWLFLSYLFLFVAFFVQGRREEKLFLAHFGDSYREYMHHTKMLIPFVL